MMMIVMLMHCVSGTTQNKCVPWRFQDNVTARIQSDSSFQSFDNMTAVSATVEEEPTVM